MEIYHYMGIGLIIVAVLLRWRLKVDLRLLFLISVVLLLTTAAMVALNETTLANDVAIVAYYSLLGGVLLLVAEMIWHNKNKENTDQPFWGDLNPKMVKLIKKIRRKGSQ